MEKKKGNRYERFSTLCRIIDMCGFIDRVLFYVPVYYILSTPIHI